MKQMTYDEYEAEVVRLARIEYPHSICVDNVREFYDRGESIQDCVDDAVFESAFWDDEFLEAAQARPLADYIVANKIKTSEGYK